MHLRKHLRRYSVLVRTNAWSETAVPEGRQAEWNGARLPVAN